MVWLLMLWCCDGLLLLQQVAAGEAVVPGE